jgi:putative endopeptidase
MEEAAFAYHGAALLGLQEIAPIEGRTLDYVNRLMGDAVGRLYVEAYFSPEAKAQSAELMQELVFAFYQRLTANSWMTESTKAKALEKLAKLRIKVGYPEQWTDYAAVEIDDSYFGSALSAFNASYRRRLAEIGAPVDKSAWPFPPQTVNAMYNALNNEIIVPAAVLQPPFFDVEADPASNFGAIGFVIGHEITHGFDTTGALFDGDGNFANWWSANDYDQFLDLNDRVAAQYSEIEVAPGRFVDGELTLAENVADLGGIQVAFAALSNELARDGRPTRDASGLTQEQRFFIAAATVWRAEIRDEALLTQLTVDPHAPSSVRGLQPLRNCDAFFAAFAIEPGDPMFLPEDERIVIW